MGDKAAGLTKKYEVIRADGKPVEWCFVLEDKDPLAIPALESYARAAMQAGYERLATDLLDKVDEMIARQPL
jgi:hypothetical protein